MVIFERSSPKTRPCLLFSLFSIAHNESGIEESLDSPNSYSSSAAPLHTEASIQVHYSQCALINVICGSRVKLCLKSVLQCPLCARNIFYFKCLKCTYVKFHHLVTPLACALCISYNGNNAKGDNSQVQRYHTRIKSALITTSSRR